MSNTHPIHQVEVRRLKADGTNYTVAAGATAVTSEPLDTAGYDGVEFIIGFGAIVATAVTSIKVRQGQQSNMSDGADLAGTSQSVADTDDNKIFRSGIYRPQERYLDVVTSRATANATIDFLVAILYGGKKEPITHGATTGGTPEVFASPAEGTA